MNNWQEIITHDLFRYIDHSNQQNLLGKPYTALASFAIDDALASSVSDKESPPVLRMWVHPKTVVLGIPDARLPYLEAGVQMLANHGYQVVVRNSGGLAVVLDEGVLNLSLILPGVKQLSINKCYEAMVRFVQYMLKDITTAIEAYEIVGSYCPGDYDLSINGKKFAGISQRRIKDGAAIQIYLDVEGKSKERAAMIKAFYEKSIQGAETKFSYPKIEPEKMASLRELLQIDLTIDDMKNRVINALHELSEELVVQDITVEEQQTFSSRYQQMLKRNEKISAIIGDFQ
ncbi:lipoate--protein ligase family protein [Virgibacillus sp. LDC-1]|uniref:lipoate--protein ligase family protein n=1 Tax=Virgibacillus sp. LDC-1 TaxID=3039856 RepID=UPI0024DE7696|nr:lipoate--protein ligase family protein [Virgibacillus sp. LDC-1]